MKRKCNNTASLKEVKAKLEQARLKKIAAEERLLRQKQQQQQQPSREEAQKALDRARSRLQGALQNRERALQQQQSKRRKAHLAPNFCATPISALQPSFSLNITNISQTGPPEMVYHNVEAMIESRKVVTTTLHRKSYNEEYTSKNKSSKNDKGAANKKQTATSTSLLQRKLELQNELLALKEKLEKQGQKQKDNKQHAATNDTAADSNDTLKPTKIVTKEGLKRRKAEAQTIMDISYWKHFVSKQEHLLEQVTTKLNETDGSYKECLQKRHTTNKAISKVQQDLDTIEQRHQVVEEGIVHSTQTLLQSRQALHHAKGQG